MLQTHCKKEAEESLQEGLGKSWGADAGLFGTAAQLQSIEGGWATE